MAALAVGVVLRHLDGERGPIRNGPFGGVYPAQDLAWQSDGSSRRLAGGPDATAQLLASLDNAGSHSVEVTGVDTDDVVTEVRWSVLRTVPGGEVSGVSTPWRDFPAAVPAHATIRLLITIHRPGYCHDGGLAADGDDSNRDLYSGSHRVHWKSLLRSHTTTVDDQIAGVRLC